MSITGWSDFTQKFALDYGADTLSEDSTTTLAPETAYILGVLTGYVGLLVITSQPAPATLTCQVVSPTGILLPFGRQVPLINGGETKTWIIPLSGSLSVTYNVQLSSSPNQTSHGTTYVLGLKSLPIPLRPDGRPYPVGDWVTRVFQSTGSGILVNAVPGWRILLKSGWIAGSEGGLIALVGGVAGMFVFTGVGGGPMALADPGPSGILFDTDQGLWLQNTGTTQIDSSVVYDLVL